MQEQTWWAQTLVGLGGGWSPDVYGLSVEAATEDEAVRALARETGAPEDPPPAVLPHIERDARARGEDDDAIVEALKKAVTTGLTSDPKGLIIVSFGTDFARVSGLDRAFAQTPTP